MQEAWPDGGVYIPPAAPNIASAASLSHAGPPSSSPPAMAPSYLDGGVGCKDNMSSYDDGGRAEVCACDGWQGGEPCGARGTGGSSVNSAVDSGGSSGDVCPEVESKSTGLGTQKCCATMPPDASFSTSEDGACQVRMTTSQLMQLFFSRSIK